MNIRSSSCKGEWCDEYPNLVVRGLLLRTAAFRTVLARDGRGLVYRLHRGIVTLRRIREEPVPPARTPVPRPYPDEPGHRHRDRKGRKGDEVRGTMRLKTKQGGRPVVAVVSDIANRGISRPERSKLAAHQAVNNRGR